MKIALAHKRLELKGGTERVFLQTALGLRDRGHDVHLFCQKFCIPIAPGITAHRVPGPSWPRTARLVSFGILAPLYIARSGCDVSLSFDRLIKQDLFRSGGGPHKTFIAKMSAHDGLRKTLWYRLSPYHRAALAIERRQLSEQGCVKLIAVCEQTRRELIEAYDLAPSRVVVIHNGVDHERFHPRSRALQGAAVRAQWGISAGSRVVLFVGSGFRRKGLHRLLNLWQIDPPPQTYLLVVGADSKLTYYRDHWHSDPHIIFAGPQSDIEKYYAAADLVALPSVQEAFGNVVLEALAAGLPVITVAGVGALDKASAALREGILQNPDDGSELRAKILRFTNPLRWTFLSRQCRATAEQYIWSSYFDQLESLFRAFAKRDIPATAASPFGAAGLSPPVAQLEPRNDYLHPDPGT